MAFDAAAPGWCYIPTMTRSNIELVEKLYEAFRRGALPFIIGAFAVDAEIVQATELPWGGTYRRLAELQTFFAKLTQNITSTLLFERILDAGDRVVAIGRTRGTVVGNGREFDLPIAHVWAVRSGKVAGFYPYIDNAGLLAALSGPETAIR